MKRTPKSLMPAASWLGKVKSAAIVLLVMLFSSATAWADDSGRSPLVVQAIWMTMILEKIHGIIIYPK